MAGVEGSEVVEYLRTELLASAQKGGREYSVNTLKTYVSHTRRKVLEADYRNVGCDFGPLMLTDPDVNSFLAAPLKSQIEIQRHHRANPSWSEEAEDALASLKLLIPHTAKKPTHTPKIRAPPKPPIRAEAYFFTDP